MSGADLLARVQAYGDFFEALTPERLDELDRYFAPDARFRDPFNDVTGIAAIRAVFEHMFRHCPRPRFEILEHAVTGRTAFIRWHFTDGRVHGRTLDVDGMSRVIFDEAGRVVEHVDYWDAASQFYERIPVLGTVLRVLRRRLQAG